MDYWKSFPYFPSHTANADVQCGVCRLELPPQLVDPAGVYETKSVWATAQSDEFNVNLNVLCHGATAHRVAISTRTATVFDERCCAVVWNECVTLPLKVRDLTSDARLALTVETTLGRVVAAASVPLFDSNGALRQGLVKLALHDGETEATIRAATAAASAAADLGGGDGGFVEQLRGDDEAPDGYGKYAQVDHLFKAELLKEKLVVKLGALRKKKRAAKDSLQWLDNLTLDVVGRRRAAFGDRQAWLEKSGFATSTEREMAQRAFLLIELSTFAHPVLFDERPYAAEATLPSYRLFRGDFDDPEKFPGVLDYETGGCLAPIEDKYRALGRDATRELVDRDLKPSISEARLIATIVSNPNDALLPRDRELLWKFRYTLTTDKKALTKFLLAVDWRMESEVAQVRELLGLWSLIDIADALKLLGPQKAFQHEIVRAFAVDALATATDEELIAYLLQLVQALRYEAIRDAALLKNAALNSTTTEEKRSFDSPLAAFLSRRAILSIEVANFVWWYLKVTAEDTSDEEASASYRLYRARFAEDLSSHAPSIYATLRAQEELVVSVLHAQARAREEKGRKDHKQASLRKFLCEVRLPTLVGEEGVPMPLDPKLYISGLHDPANTARVYRSAMYPANVSFERLKDKIKRNAKPTKARVLLEQPAVAPMNKTPSTGSFLEGVANNLATLVVGNAEVASEEPTDSTKLSLPTEEERPYRLIVKNGDDLRQDQLVLQFVLLMDLLLKRVNLDLKLTCFRALATGASSGLIEFVEESHAISTILADHNGSILAFLQRHNPDPAQPDGLSERARDNFTRSTAGYCVITYLLGIGDRHLDNIMVRNNGCLFHIDFGFILGKDPKPYPPPFRLTKEMAEAMNYSKFKTKCCQAYNCLRKHASLLLNLMSLMKDAGIEHLSEDPEIKLAKFQDRFRLDLSDEDAERFFLSLINESLNALVPVVLERFHKIAVWMK